MEGLEGQLAPLLAVLNDDLVVGLLLLRRVLLLRGVVVLLEGVEVVGHLPDVLVLEEDVGPEVLNPKRLLVELEDLAVEPALEVEGLALALLLGEAEGVEDGGVVVDELADAVVVGVVLALLVQREVDHLVGDVDARVVQVVGHGDHAGRVEAEAEAARADLAVDVEKQVLVDELGREDLRVLHEHLLELLPGRLDLALVLDQAGDQDAVLAQLLIELAPLAEELHVGHHAQVGVPVALLPERHLVDDPEGERLLLPVVTVLAKDVRVLEHYGPQHWVQLHLLHAQEHLVGDEEVSLPVLDILLAADAK
mmetsp:Transcript_14219/g.24180  ORF Transcript_14219/g.24180 Transcript_14219/m.24180 type:complete len:309 (-) Transcript_14219:152-1078(-)